ncbi:MAG: S-adenosyl-L-methionine-binding protein [Methanoregulaceae archaeon PtaB.Bin108]|nr:MAG: S-adenosyl-L-methionine-binding protein [Methanoregulaceae archaeon PtaB.Bin108]OPY46301.1 MAG: S-adenosyl-L-methionine-binding protein [Methanoregulaceae archaeon PtaU1.Bin222]
MKRTASSTHEPPSTITLFPVGIICNAIREPTLVAGGDGLYMRGTHAEMVERVRRSDNEVSRIVIREDLEDILTGIEAYSHLVVLYWAHAVPDERRSLTRVHPMGRKDLPEVGIFGTCSQARPNPVLTTVARLVQRKENVLEVTGLDAINGSPVIDIKPYVSGFYPREGVRIPAWMQQIQDEIGR